MHIYIHNSGHSWLLGVWVSFWVGCDMHLLLNIDPVYRPRPKKNRDRLVSGPGFGLSLIPSD